MNINRKFSSANYSERLEQINLVILHFTEINFTQALERLCNPDAKVSAHYLIKADGEIFNLVDEAHTAWHAGDSYWQGVEKLNEHSIGIEIDNDGRSNFPLKQMDSCVALCKVLKSKYGISSKNFIGHSDVAPARKIDPGILFDWSYLATFGLGHSHNAQISLNQKHSKILLDFGSTEPSVFELQTNLSKLGYKINITSVFDNQTNYVVRAFQAHFYPALLLELGMDSYWNKYSKYFWDEASELILQSLLEIT